MIYPDFIQMYDRITSNGWLTIEEAKLLVDSAERTSGPMVEVGSYQGRSAMLLGQLDRPLYCIDPWDDSFHSDLKGDEIYSRFLAHIQSLPNAGYNIIPVRMLVEDWIPFPSEFIYLDGDHTYRGTCNQILKALAATPKIIAIHDVNDRGGGVEVQRAARDILGNWSERIGSLAIWEK